MKCTMASDSLASTSTFFNSTQLSSNSCCAPSSAGHAVSDGTKAAKSGGSGSWKWPSSTTAVSPAGTPALGTVSDADWSSSSVALWYDAGSGEGSRLSAFLIIITMKLTATVRTMELWHQAWQSHNWARMMSVYEQQTRVEGGAVPIRHVRKTWMCDCRIFGTLPHFSHILAKWAYHIFWHFWRQ